jgi:hypothetical protein
MTDSTLWCSILLALAQAASSAWENHPPILMAKSTSASKIQILSLHLIKHLHTLCHYWTTCLPGKMMIKREECTAEGRRVLLWK